MEKYEFLKALLELGADPNLASETTFIDGVGYIGETPLYRAEKTITEFWNI